MDQVLNEPSLQPLFSDFNRAFITDCVRDVLEQWRKSINEGKTTDVDKARIIEDVLKSIETKNSYNLKRVVNATGIVVHTNLGRSLLPKALEEHMIDIAFHYNTLEYDPEKGERGSRYSHVEQLLKDFLHVEAAMVVNNNAAAVLLALSTLAHGKEVVVSRGELIEIGGSFRIPDVMVQSGAVLREVGTTNRTRETDYIDAINENTALLFKAHTSNYRIIGFTEEVSYEKLVNIGQRYGVPVMVDLGSGVLVDLSAYGLAHEPTVQEVVNSGVDIVTFSGDKLLGGPQAGIIVGKKEYVDAMKHNPLTRALRVDKLCLSMLEGVLKIYQQRWPMESIPTLNMMIAPLSLLKERAERLKSMLESVTKLECTVIELSSEAGGGSLPEQGIPSFGLALRMDGMSAAELSQALRLNKIPIIARIVDENVVMDIRTIQDEEFGIIVSALQDMSSHL